MSYINVKMWILTWAETLNLSVYNLGVCNWNLSDNILYLVSFTFKLAEEMAYIFVAHKCSISGFCMIYS